MANDFKKRDDLCGGIGILGFVLGVMLLVAIGSGVTYGVGHAFTAYWWLLGATILGAVFCALCTSEEDLGRPMWSVVVAAVALLLISLKVMFVKTAGLKIVALGVNHPKQACVWAGIALVVVAIALMAQVMAWFRQLEELNEAPARKH